ncbi:hypothetical protein LIS04_96 [Listeria phage LIS04]|nr:hypothetical protein LIS04_96 [Listeria phage LIS04]
MRGGSYMIGQSGIALIDGRPEVVEVTGRYPTAKSLYYSVVKFENPNSDVICNDLLESWRIIATFPPGVNIKEILVSGVSRYIIFCQNCFHQEGPNGIQASIISANDFTCKCNRS